MKTLSLLFVSVFIVHNCFSNELESDLNFLEPRTGYAALTEESTKKLVESGLYQIGYNDAEIYHHTDGRGLGNFALGLGFGVIPIIVTAVSDPKPVPAVIANSGHTEEMKSFEYKLGYAKKAKQKAIGYHAAGWGSWFVIILLAAL